MTFTPLRPAAGITSIVTMAFGANPDADPSTWTTWYDVTPWVRGDVTISKGRPDQAQSADATRIDFELDNTDGRFTPGNPLSPYWPNVVRNVPVRVQLTGFGDAAPYERATAFVNGWPLQPIAGVIAIRTPISASGRLRRMQTRTKPLRSALTRTVAAMSGLLAHWPLEDGSLASYAAATSSTVPAMTPTGSITFASANPAGSGPLPDFSGGGSLLGSLSGAPVGAMEVGFTFHALQTSTAICPAVWRTSGGLVFSMTLNAGSNQLDIGDSTGILVSLVGLANLLDGAWHSVQVTAIQNGGNIDASVTIDGATNITTSALAGTLGAFRNIQPGANLYPTTFTAQRYNLGEVYVVNPAGLTPATAANFAAAVSGFTGETAAARATRVTGELGIPSTVTTGSLGTVQAMGPQGIATSVAILQDAEKVDFARMHDGGPLGRLMFAANNVRYNQAVGLALDYLRGHLRDTLRGTFDDQGIVTDSELSRPSGASAEYAVASAEGEYDEGLTYNAATDGQLLYLAEQRVAAGTYADMRFPMVDVDLVGTPELAPQIVGMTVGTRVSISNLPVPKYPPGTVDLFIEGYTEVISAITWRFSLVCTPGRMYRAAVVEDATNPWVVDAGDSTLSAGINASVTSMSVATAAGPLWSTSGGDYPRYVDVDGEQIRIDAMSGAASPQTATIVRAINGISKAHSTNAVVRLYRPAVIAL